MGDSDVMSQEEIDALLRQFSTGELDVTERQQEEKRQIKNYDFKRPSKFSKDHLRTLEIIFEHYGRLLSTNLPVYLRKNVQIEIISAEALAYNEFSNSLANPVLLGIINFAPLQGNIVLELAANIGYTIVDRMLGGAGEPLERSRDFSEIELMIVERIFNICVNLLREPWQNVISIEPRLERIETNSQFAQIISPTEMIALITINVKIGNVDGLMHVCLPYMTLEEVIDKLNTKYWFSTMQNKTDEGSKEVIESILSKAKVPIKAVLGKSIISVNDFVNLQKGDIIKLSSKADEELDIYVGNILKFKALPGSASEVYAMKITSVVREE